MQTRIAEPSSGFKGQKVIGQGTLCSPLACVYVCVSCTVYHILHIPTTQSHTHIHTHIESHITHTPHKYNTYTTHIQHTYVTHTQNTHIHTLIHQTFMYVYQTHILKHIPHTYTLTHTRIPNTHTHILSQQAQSHAPHTHTLTH